jgi:hypothetical protein
MNGKYSIKDLENLTGIKAHTLRIWEQRYGLVSPQRTDTNIRLYSDDDLKKLLNVAVLVHAGHKISAVATWSPMRFIRPFNVRHWKRPNTNPRFRL